MKKLYLIVLLFTMASFSSADELRLELTGPFLVGSYNCDTGDLELCGVPSEFGFSYGFSQINNWKLALGVSQVKSKYKLKENSASNYEKFTSDHQVLSFITRREIKITENWDFEPFIRLGYGSFNFYNEATENDKNVTAGLLGVGFGLNYNFSGQIFFTFGTGARRILINEVEIDDKKFNSNDFNSADLYHSIGLGFHF